MFAKQMPKKQLFWIVAALLCAAGLLASTQLAFAQAPVSPAEPASGAPIDPSSGKELYNSYCALCHGANGKGGGPFSSQLKTWPPDLTGFTKNNHGVYPELRIAETIDGEFARPSHGSAQMPIWGPIFRSMAHGHKDSAQSRIDNLVRYLESI